MRKVCLCDALELTSKQTRCGKLGASQKRCGYRCMTQQSEVSCGGLGGVPCQ